LVAFKPIVVLRNNHLQTIIPSLLPISNSLKKNEEIIVIPLKDGDQIQVKCNWNQITKKVVYLVHGLEGSSDARYMIQVSQKLFAEGYTTIRINLRNCGGTEKLSKSLYNAGMSDDLDEVITFFKNYQWQEITLIGFSLGGNLVGKFVGERENRIASNIKKAILICPPLDLYSTILQFKKGLNWLYDSHFTTLLKAKYKKKCIDHPDLYDDLKLQKIKSLYSFDDLITGPHFGFKNGLAYYEWASSQQYLNLTSIPITIIQSLDDPIIDASVCEKFSLTCNKHIKVLLYKKGGHVGFYGYDNHCSKAAQWLSQQIYSLIQEPND
jgi:predicted alpha/beta-fold hydrolase